MDTQSKRRLSPNAALVASACVLTGLIVVAAGSALQPTLRPRSRSNQELPTMPWVRGNAPVETVACPTQVTVARYG